MNGKFAKMETSGEGMRLLLVRRHAVVSSRWTVDDFGFLFIHDQRLACQEGAEGDNAKVIRRCAAGPGEREAQKTSSLSFQSGWSKAIVKGPRWIGGVGGRASIKGEMLEAGANETTGTTSSRRRARGSKIRRMNGTKEGRRLTNQQMIDYE